MYMELKTAHHFSIFCKEILIGRYYENRNREMMRSVEQPTERAIDYNSQASWFLFELKSCLFNLIGKRILYIKITFQNWMGFNP